MPALQRDRSPLILIGGPFKFVQTGQGRRVHLVDLPARARPPGADKARVAFQIRDEGRIERDTVSRNEPRTCHLLVIRLTGAK